MVKIRGAQIEDGSISETELDAALAAKVNAAVSADDLGGAAVLDVGTTAGTVAAGDHDHDTDYAATSHSHAIGDVSGVVPAAQGGAGTVTGILKADGLGTVTAAAAGTDYSAGTASLATGLLKSTTTTGALSIAAADTDYASVYRHLRRGRGIVPPDMRVAYRVPTDATTGWAAFNTSATLSVDTTHVRGSLATPRGALTIAGKGSLTYATADYTVGGTVDLTNTIAHIRFYVLDGSNPTVISLYVRSDAAWTNNTYEDVYDSTIAKASVDGHWMDVWMSAPGGAGWVNSGSINVAAVDKIRVAVYQAAASAVPLITVDAIEFYRKPARIPRHAITFDDGRATQYAAAQYLAARGLRATFYVITSLVGSDAGYLTLAQLKEMREMGHLIANHSYSHTYDTTGAARVEQVTKAAEWLESNGFGDGARHFSLPGGTSEWDAAEDPAILGVYCDTFRLTAWMSHGTSPLTRELLTTQAFDNASKATTLASEGVASGLDTIVGFHEGNVTGFEAYVDAVATLRNAGSLDVVTIDELAGRGVTNLAPYAPLASPTFTGRITAPTATFTTLPVYADNAAALAGGLTANQVYRTSTGVLMVTY